MATIDDLNEDLQRQSVSSQVELWELELSPSSFAYFYSGLDEDLGEVQFRQRGGGATINNYEAIPIEGEGFSLQSDGPSARPKITVANILTTFSDALGGLTNKDLLGKKIYRRRTLEKYLYPTDTSDPAVEMPTQMYFIDRIAEESILHIKFELASPFDLNGIRLPKRVVMGNSCSWRYQGSAPEIAAADRQGSCTWSQGGLIKIDGSTEKRVYFNKDDEPIVSDGNTITVYTSGAITKNQLYRTNADTSGFKKVDENGNLVAPGTVYDYWQAVNTSSSPGTLSDSNPNVRRVRVYDAAWGSGVTYNAYTDSRYNEYAARSNRVWQVKNKTVTGTPNPTINPGWQIGDQCSKSLTACTLRYCTRWSTAGGGTGRPAVDKIRNKEIPFGGFPGISN
jgi:lambda family phage minor tail protein L